MDIVTLRRRYKLEDSLAMSVNVRFNVLAELGTSRCYQEHSRARSFEIQLDVVVNCTHHNYYKHDYHPRTTDLRNAIPRRFKRKSEHGYASLGQNRWNQVLGEASWCKTLLATTKGNSGVYIGPRAALTKKPAA